MKEKVMNDDELGLQISIMKLLDKSTVKNSNKRDLLLKIAIMGQLNTKCTKDLFLNYVDRAWDYYDTTR